MTKMMQQMTAKMGELNQKIDGMSHHIEMSGSGSVNHDQSGDKPEDAYMGGHTSVHFESHMSRDSNHD